MYLSLLWTGVWVKCGLGLLLKAFIVYETLGLLCDCNDIPRRSIYSVLFLWVLSVCNFNQSVPFIVSVMGLTDLYPLARHTAISSSLFLIAIVFSYFAIRDRRTFNFVGWTWFICVPYAFLMHCYAKLILCGIIWAICVMVSTQVNDVAAYLAGKHWGRTAISDLSPKKTWEGYLGGGIGSILSVLLASMVFSPYPGLTGTFIPSILPSKGHSSLYRSIAANSSTVDSIGPLYIGPRGIHQPSYTTLAQVLGAVDQFVPLLPISLLEKASLVASSEALTSPLPIYTLFLRHAMLIAVYAAIVAPIGGFFASGIKRACNIKDFGSVLPGHGGVLDRFDCNLMTLAFFTAYMDSFLIGALWHKESILMNFYSLPPQQQRDLFLQLQNQLLQQNLLTPLLATPSVSN
ncbi:unnamed protein product [Cyprideis torosa]|uniref:Phosphatidate cytidylyltransferase n=1 Tax=Cyprideis torosa TaxID=163714 RepID=A0A7R8WBN8_9CRUS|nr:unnamed protein product [Cyprideis torosa]CAG0886665.1 unnamed protein product [Cyprideis torosa]